jgi:alanyl-tRNA synthetase
VIDTTFALPNLRRHRAVVDSGAIVPGQTATAAIDSERRAAIRRNHTATHLLHHALRDVLGDHVKQAGSMVGPDRLRFDFSHYEAVTDEQIAEIERLTNAETLANTATRIFETTKDEAEALGAIAFFGDKYGDIVRVLEAGSSIELCGGTHVRATGDIGTVKVVSESSIGSNLRRIEAVTGEASVALLQRDEQLLADTARLVGAPADDVLGGVQRKLDEIKSLHDEIKSLRGQLAIGRATELAAIAHDGVLVTRVDGLTPGDLRELAIAVRQQPGVRLVVLIGETTSGGVGLVAAVEPGGDAPASELIKDAARAVDGGGGGKGDIATAGGKNPSGIPEALELAARAAAAAIGA